MKKVFAILVLSMLLLGFGCTQNNGTPAPQPNTTQNKGANSTGGTGASLTIHISNFAFVPAGLTVKQGDTVTWVNDDPVGHEIKSDSGGFDSATLSTGDTFSHTFSEAPGDYAYHCAIHPSMTGKITVTK